jgi:hypothetical protein
MLRFTEVDVATYSVNHNPANSAEALENLATLSEQLYAMQFLPLCMNSRGEAAKQINETQYWLQALRTGLGTLIDNLRVYIDAADTKLGAADAKAEKQFL